MKKLILILLFCTLFLSDIIGRESDSSQPEEIIHLFSNTLTVQHPGTVEGHLNNWFIQQIANEETTPNQFISGLLMGSMGAANIPLFTMLGMGGAKAAFPNTPALAYFLTACSGIAIGSQFIVTSWEVGKNLARDESHTCLKRLYFFSKYTTQFVLASLANIPIPYLTYLQFGAALGRGNYILGVAAFLGGNWAWMWTLDFYTVKAERYVARRSSPALAKISKTITQIKEIFNCLPESDIDNIYDRIFNNHNALNEFSSMLEHPHSHFVSCTRSKTSFPQEFASHLIGGASAIVSGIGAFASYNLGVVAAEQMLQWVGVTSPNVVSALSVISGSVGVGIMGTFNVITGYKVMKSAVDSLFTFCRAPLDCKLSCQSVLSGVGNLVKTTSFFFLAAGASFPQTYITLKNISQKTSYALFVDICSFIGGIPSGYWAMNELFEKFNRIFKREGCTPLPLSSQEKRGILIEICDQLENSIYALSQEEIESLRQKL